MQTRAEDLAAAVERARVVCPSQPRIPALGGVKIERGVVSATDLDVSVSATYRARYEDVSYIAPAKLLSSVLKHLTGDTDVRVSDDGLVLTDARRSYTVKGWESSDMPILPGIDAEGQAEHVPAEVLIDLWRKVAPAVAKDDYRPLYTNVLLSLAHGSVSMVGTDTYRLARAERSLDVSGGTGSLVPRRVFDLMSKPVLRKAMRGDVSITFGATSARFVCGGVTIGTRLHEGEFPDYLSLMPDTENARSFEVERDVFAGAVKAIGVLAQKNAPVRLSLADTVKLSAKTLGVGEASEVLKGVDTSAYWSALTIGLNPGYLLDGLSVLDGETVKVYANKSSAPILVSEAGFDYLLMSVRIAGEEG